MIEKYKTLFFVKSSLISLYLALTIPIPFIAIDKLKIPSIIAFALGLYLIINITSDYVETCSNKISTILPNLEQNIDHKEIGTPKTHKKFLGRYEGSYGPIPSHKLLGLLPMPFNSTKIKNLYCVGDSCFPGQGLNAVAFSGYACAHKIGAKLNKNSLKLPD